MQRPIYSWRADNIDQPSDRATLILSVPTCCLYQNCHIPFGNLAVNVVPPFHPNLFCNHTHVCTTPGCGTLRSGSGSQCSDKPHTLEAPLRGVRSGLMSPISKEIL
ncbi:hypothetical protein AcW1_001882 [Taiwanofungus camphoratus]|nr:hypothetical protein AcW1_001882 [Antrodia cinnamomea]